MELNHHNTSAEEKSRLIQAFYESGLTRVEFCERHGLVYKTFTRWLKSYSKDGETGLKTRREKAYAKIAPNLKSEEELRYEILKLQIENERLKKNYAVRTTEDGKTEYIRLKAKNTK